LFLQKIQEFVNNTEEVSSKYLAKCSEILFLKHYSKKIKVHLNYLIKVTKIFAKRNFGLINVNVNISHLEKKLITNKSL
jgi:hypothetical protein